MPRTTIDELPAQARGQLEPLDPAGARDAMGSGATLIDIRSDTQIAQDGEIVGALVIARNVLEWRLDPASECRDASAPGLDDHVIPGVQRGLPVKPRSGDAPTTRLCARDRP